MPRLGRIPSLTVPFLVLFAAAAFPDSVRAADSDLPGSSTSASPVQVPQPTDPVAATNNSAANAKSGANVTPGSEQVDELITNNNLRAYSGSKSRWSIASKFTYNGGSISNPLAEDRPNITSASGVTTKSALNGSVSLKYNINAKQSLLAGIGVRWIAPLSPGGPSNYNGTVFDAMNPYVTYQYLWRWAGVQSVLQVQGLQWTQADQRALGYARQLSVDWENMYEVGRSGLSFGAAVLVFHQGFDKSGAFGTPGSSNYIPDLAAVQSGYGFEFAPLIEYQLSDKVNLRTVLGYFEFEHYLVDPVALSFTHDTAYQSVGVGVSVSRDVFLYPNVQFLPGSLRASLTNVAITATVNLF